MLQNDVEVAARSSAVSTSVSSHLSKTASDWELGARNGGCRHVYEGVWVRFVGAKEGRRVGCGDGEDDEAGLGLSQVTTTAQKTWASPLCPPKRLLPYGIGYSEMLLQLWGSKFGGLPRCRHGHKSFG